MNLFKILERASDIFISTDPDLIKKAAAAIPLTEINQILKTYIEMKGLKNMNFFQPTEDELIEEMQIENFWNALETIDTEESGYSSWIDQVNSDKLNFELQFDVWKFN
ncbi:putative fungal zinc cluster transcription factor, partial [Candida maltosa Xu316]